MDFLLKLLPSGQGTYTVMIATLIFAWAGFFAGMHTAETAIQFTLGALGLGTVRRALK
jgi:hypothetical protein